MTAVLQILLNLFQLQGGEEDVFPVEFDLCFGDKVFTYKAVSYEEKKRFLTALISLSDRTQMSGSVMRVGSDTFGDPIFQKGLQN